MPFWIAAALSFLGSQSKSNKQAEQQQKLIEAQKDDPWATEGSTTLWIGISVGLVALIIVIFFAVRAFKGKKKG